MLQRFFRGARVRRFLKHMRAAHQKSTPDAQALHDLLFEMKLARFIDAFTALKLEKQQLRVISVAELCQVTAGCCCCCWWRVQSERVLRPRGMIE